MSLAHSTKVWLYCSMTLESSFMTIFVNFGLYEPSSPSSKELHDYHSGPKSFHLYHLSIKVNWKADLLWSNSMDKNCRHLTSKASAMTTVPLPQLLQFWFYFISCENVKSHLFVLSFIWWFVDVVVVLFIFKFERKIWCIEMKLNAPESTSNTLALTR